MGDSMKNEVKAFFDCGDNQIIEFALMRARLNRVEREVLYYIIDECMTQEQVAEKLDCSTRRVQDVWYKASEKLMSIPWVRAYAKELMEGE